MKILYFLHTLIVYSVLVLDTLVFANLAIVFGFFNPYSKYTNWVLRSWAKVILWISGIKLTIEGADKIDLSKPHIYTINHIGSLDIPAIFAAVPQTARFIAKKELFKIPLFSTGMRYAGMLPIDRGNSDEAKKTLKMATQTMKKDNCSVLIFPEGTRSKRGQIENFKKGGFVLSLQSKIPIIPTVIEGSQYIFPNGGQLIKRGKINIKFLEKVDTSSYSIETRNILVKEVRNKMIDNFDQNFNSKDNI